MLWPIEFKGVIVGNVRVHLHGGPEGGREYDAPTDSAGLPIPRLTFPARPPRNTQQPAGPHPPLLIYERQDQLADGTWEFHYVGVESQFGD
jgi:hypothetical protein